ncbi:hypothetical protein GE061_018994 [Apolygus lucorum]|uniref:Uncharacterized protein n=1 Tax=Apolygus lucorum TaxID=248454 RepID=A0A8S9X951_APOLU|nr:hypothetical protein GE061_018994 [Apolygus lucorum]
MSVSVRLRMVSRTAFNRLAHEIEQMLNHQDVDYDVLTSMIARLERRMQELEKMDRAILEEMPSAEDMPEVDIDKETKEADGIAIRGFYLSRKSKAILDPSKVTNSTASNKLEEEPSNTMMATTMFSIVNPETVCNLLNLDDLGIQDPHQKKTKEKRAEETHKFFLDTVRNNEQGRDEVGLHWMEDHTPILRNLVVAKRRLDRTLIKLRETDTQYDNVFNEWLNEEILERNFTGADSVFMRFDWYKFSMFCTIGRIEWRFNLPSGPWWGGWWQLLLGIIKQARRKKKLRTGMRKRFRNEYLGKLARTAKKVTRKLKIREIVLSGSYDDQQT